MFLENNNSDKEVFNHDVELEHSQLLPIILV
jgi:hypothetical protein